MAYGLKYTLNFDDIHKTEPAKWLVEFYFQDYTGDSTELIGSDDPLVITRGEQGQDKMVPIAGSKAEIEIIITDDSFDKTQFFVIEQFQIKVQITKKDYQDNEIYWWGGYVKPDYCEFPYTPTPYPFKIIATDGIALLKNNLIDLTDIKRGSGYVSVLNTLMERGLFQTQHGLNKLRVISSLHRTTKTQTFDNLSTRFELWVDDQGAFMNIYDILVQLATSFTGRLFFDSEYIWFQRIADLPNQTPTILEYSAYDQAPTDVILDDPFVKILKGEISSSEMIYKNNDAYITIMSPYKQSQIDVDYKFRTYIQNGDWHDWDGTDFDHWTRNSEATIDRHGDGTPENPYCLYMQKYSSGEGILWQAVTDIYQGYKFKFETTIKFYKTNIMSFRFFICKPAAPGEDQSDDSLKRLVFVDSGNWVNAQDNLGNLGNYHVNRNTNVENKTTISIDMRKFSLNQIEFQPDDPVVLLIYIIDPDGSVSESTPYNGMEVEEIKLSVMKNDYTGETYTNRTGKNYSKYNQVDDFTVLSAVDPSIANGLHYEGESINQYWTSDDVPYAIDSMQGLSLYSIMNINSFPYEIMEGSFYSNKVRFFNVIQRAFGEFKLFMQLYDEYHVKHCDHKMTLAEIREVKGIAAGTSSIRKFKIDN